MNPSARLRPWLGLATVLALAGSSAAAAQQQPAPDPLTLTVDGMLGNDLLGAGTWLPLAVRVSNRTSDRIRGNLRAQIDGYGLEARPIVERPFVVGPHATVRVQMLVRGFGPGGAARVDAIDAAGAPLGRATRAIAFRPGPSVLVIGDRDALPGAIAEELYEDPREDYRQDGIATRNHPVIGLPALDDAGRELLPDSALVYGGIRAVVATHAGLDRAGPPARRALLDWVHTGGRLVVLQPSADPPSPAWLADDVPERDLSQARDASEIGRGTRVAEEHGATSRRLGFGWVTFAPSSVAVDSQALDPVSRAAIAAALERNVSPGDSPAVGVGWASGHPRGSELSDADLAAKLDPNRVSAFWLSVAGVLLVLYVVAVGPLNFRLLLRRPALALITTPLLAGACALLLLGVGVLHKGIRSRYRRIELLEATEGAQRVVASRLTAAFFARPTEVALRFGPEWRGVVSAGRGDRIPTTARVAGDRVEVAPFSVSTWDTIGLHEEAIRPLGGAVEVEATEPSGGTVHNRTDRWLRSAVVVEGSRVCSLGDIAPGRAATFHGCRWTRTLQLDVESHERALRAPFALLRNEAYPGYDVPERAARALGGGEATVEVLEPLLRQGVVGRTVSVLLARVRPESSDPFRATLSRELDVALLRIVPAMPPSPRWLGVSASEPSSNAAEVAP